MSKGWHGDKLKHKLASKGVRTKYTHGGEFIPETPQERRLRRRQTVSQMRLFGKEDPDSLFFESNGELNGLANKSGLTEDDVNPNELRMGIKIEMEHTDDEDVAKQIALDHLAEYNDYYTRLTEAGL